MAPAGTAGPGPAGLRSPSVTATVVGICGGSGAGKTTLTRHLLDRIGHHRVSVLAFDAYYRCQSALTPRDRSRVNYDHPASLDHELFAAHLAALRAGDDVEVPVYDFATHTRTDEVEVIEARDVVLVEGILLFSFPEITPLLDVRVFLDVPAEVRLERRILRDVAERGREPDDVRRQFAATVSPMHDEFVQPHRHRATRVVRLGDPFDRVAEQLATEITAGPVLVRPRSATINSSG